MTAKTIQVDDLNAAIEEYRALGWRVEMIFPADSPREALISSGNAKKRLVCTVQHTEEDTNWHVGRAGMMYRDLIPDRIGGKVIASHIRILEDGPIDDKVHYHKVDFQMIYCLKGRIEVVYEDQGPPFWLEPGDCVVQPPEIRHRVLFAEGNAEVLEVTSPAEHETWFDHELELPNSTVKVDRQFNGQAFVFTNDVEK